MRPARDGQAPEAIQQRESRAAEQTELRVGELKVGFDRGRQDGDDASVHRIEGIGRHQQ
jgi:hypothetical protein